MSFRAGQSATCPHCKTGVRLEPVQLNGTNGSQQATINTAGGYTLTLLLSSCPSCGKAIIVAQQEGPPNQVGRQVAQALLWPDTAARPVPAEVEAAAPTLAADFREAVSVYSKSMKASAALSRRCLQFVLSDKGGAKKKDLADQIDEVLPSLPSQLSLNVDAIRQVGNFAAHPTKSTSSGQIVDVEEGEAEWLLDVLEELFEYFYVAPAKAADRRTALNAKLAGIGKPPLKAP